MARRSKIHVGLEIGTSKTCLVVAEAREDGSLKVLGIGETKSAGVRRGEIFEYNQARACLQDALTRAEDASGVEIGRVHLAVTGPRIFGVNNRGTVRLPEGEEVVTLDHIEEAQSLARDVKIPQDHLFVHYIMRRFWLDGLEQPVSPVGLHGHTVEVDFHVVHGPSARIQNSIKLVREASLELADVVFSPVAAAQMALDTDQRERGALIIDIGGGATDYALYQGGAIAACGCIPAGGDHITNDIHLVTGVPFSSAERLKVLEGDASADPARSAGMARLEDDRGFAEVEVARSVLNEVIRQRIDETLRLVREQLPPGALEALDGGVFLTGGTSLMRGLGEVAFDVFGRDIYRPDIPSVTGNQATFRDPRYATAIGLIRYAQAVEKAQEEPAGCLTRLFRAVFGHGA
jgi:cell division protein FtsA